MSAVDTLRRYNAGLPAEHGEAVDTVAKVVAAAKAVLEFEEGPLSAFPWPCSLCRAGEFCKMCALAKALTEAGAL